MKANKSLLVMCVIVLQSFCFEAFAHQLKQAITTVYFNPRTDNIEVMHRFEIHDAEHAVKQIFGTRADIISDADTQAQFSQYVVDRFAMYSQKEANEEQMLALKTVGFEVEGKHFWVYQETPAPTVLEGLYIQHNALRDIWHTQTNTINVEGKGDIKTLTFTDNVEMLKVVFKHH